MQKPSRKQEFLITAMKLFSKKGYDKTSVQNIIDELNVSKGAFYHYFDSKESILSAIAEQMTRQACGLIENVITENNLNALEKLNKLFVDVQSYKVEHHEKKKILGKVFLNRMDDPKFQREMMDMAKDVIVPQMRRLFVQGVEEGVFHTDYPEDLAEHYFEIMSAMKMSIVKPIQGLSKHPENKKIIERKLNFFQDLLERLLGVKKGSINLTKPMLKRYLTYKFE